MAIATGGKYAAIILVALLVLGGLPALGVAQSDRPRSETGRHKPVPPPKKTQEELATEVAAGSGGATWFVGLAGGFQGGGDLWHLETADGLARPWVSATPFTTSRFNAMLDRNLGLGLFVGRRMGEMWSLRADLNSSRMDIGAEALQGQQGAVFLYDQLTVTTVGLAAEIRLARVASYPYVSAGVVVNMMSAARENELDQDQLGFRLGLGFLKVLTPELSLRAEARYSRSRFEVGSFVPQTIFANQPELIFEPNDRLNLFDVFLALELNL